MVIPGVLFMSTMKQEIPLCLSVLSVVAKTTPNDASFELVIHALLPFSIQWSPSSLAVVLAAPASLPLPGSVTNWWCYPLGEEKKGVEY